MPDFPVYIFVSVGNIGGQASERWSMTGKTDTVPYDEEAAIEAAQERSAAPHLRDVLKREYNEQLKGYPHNVALEEWGPEVEAWIQDELYRSNR